jgi:hypothetical protein
MNDMESQEDVTVADIRGGIAIAIRRFQTLAKDPHLEPRAVMNELAETVLPIVDDSLVLVDRLESFANWAGDEIEDLQEDGEASQLLPEDSARFVDFFQTVIEQSEASMNGLDPESTQHKALTLLRDEARTLLVFTNEITLDVPEADDDDDEPDDEAGKEEEAHGRDDH